MLQSSGRRSRILHDRRLQLCRIKALSMKGTIGDMRRGRGRKECVDGPCINPWMKERLER
ncbi:hypothetical protein BOSEA31B_20660 [Hyphomicrobiales bacterium]|nr:hypothetical protein BOSEA31B_20660 [Hyphomicrobiales bacterium]CAH1702846.1 hypothetical protein BOSEA1005_30718 [Hyphomicrobiales bacterium]